MARRAPTHPTRRRVALGLGALAVAALLQLAQPQSAAAAVTHLHGFQATVDGFTSWYGSYGMGSLGTAWCIDHGIHAPDPVYAYAPADLSAVPPDVRAAVGWAVAMHGQGDDRVRHAAVMLALHDLMGARYPSGRLDVDRLGVARLAGFGGLEAQVLDAARAIKADALAHASLRGPLVLTDAAGPIDGAGQSTLTVALHDAIGQGVGGVPVHLDGAGPGGTLTTGVDGTAVTAVAATAQVTAMHASAQVPRLPVDAWAPTTARAQRVARPVLDELRASATVDAAHGELVIVKRGDATPWLPVEGATFRIEPEGAGEAHVVTIGPAGTAPGVTLPIGTHHVVEQEPPPGYDIGGPWTVTIEHGRTTTLEVTDAARRGALRIEKLGEDTGGPLAGATLDVRYDADADGMFEQLVTELTTDGQAATLDGLLPGRYEIVETSAPRGYVQLDEPALVDVIPGATATVVLVNHQEPRPPTATPSTPTTVAPPAPPAPLAPPAAAPPSVPPPTVLSAPTVERAPVALPRTGLDVVSLALSGAGLVLVGSAATDLARVRAAAAQPSAPAARSAAIRSSS